LKQFALLLALVLQGPLAFADTSSSITQEPVTLDKFTVSGVPVDSDILPTIRPIGSVLGDDRSILDTPRSVSSVDAAWMTDRDVDNTMELGQFSPGVYSQALYGLAAVPQIRGELAEIYLNGQRTLYSNNSVLPSFNGVESMDIVKGPGSAVYGPQGMGPGGYVNMVTKQPFFDSEHTTIGMTLGDWTSGHSNSNPEFRIDNSGPINDQLAYRVSYLSRYGDGYYENTKNETQDIYTALTYMATKKLKFEWFGWYYKNRFNQVPGQNRVTQELIDNGTYIAGSVIEPYPGSAYLNILNASTAHTVTLPDYISVEGPYDHDNSKRFQTQLLATLDLTETSKIVNLSYFEDRTSSKFELNGYDEYVPTNWSFNDRAQYEKTFEVAHWEDKAIVGFDYRIDRLVSYQDFSVQPFNIYDLTEPLSLIAIPGYSGNGFGGPAIPGVPGYSANAGASSGVQDSTTSDYAMFYQQDITLTNKLSANLGVRADRIQSHAENPALVGEPLGSTYDSSAIITDYSYFGSLMYKPTALSSVYFTYDRVNSITGSGNFGGVDGTGGNSGLKRSLSALSKLYELGYKQSLLKNQLYSGVALFEQTHMQPALVGPAVKIRDMGVEWEAVYQPTEKLSINANFTYQDATSYDTFFYEQTGNYRDFYPSTLIIDGKPGTGVLGVTGSPSYSGYISPKGQIKEPGEPGVLGNLFVEYNLTPNFGFGAGPQFDGRQNANAEGTLVIPSQTEVDGFIRFRTKRWTVRVNLKNLLNKRLLDPINTGFAGNDVIYVRPPITASLSIDFRF